MSFASFRAFLIVAGTLLVSTPALATNLTVFAAASLKDALDDVATAFEHEFGTGVTISYAGSSTLARQIEYGAPVDLFISANEAWMDRLSRDQKLAPDTRGELLSNGLVLIGPASDPRALNLASPVELNAALGDGKLAMALVDAVPAGIYGKAALQHLNLWESVSDQVAQTDNVRAAMALVSIGAAPLGVVYTTDARADDRVSVKATFPANSHPPVIYPVAIINTSEHPDARAFLDYLQSPFADGVFTSYGFNLPAE